MHRTLVPVADSAVLAAGHRMTGGGGSAVPATAPGGVSSGLPDVMVDVNIYSGGWKWVSAFVEPGDTGQIHRLPSHMWASQSL
jgi:hypothetical protein